MDDIRSSLDNMVDQFNDSITHSAPKKLLFNRLSISLSDDSATLPKKRRMEQESPNCSLNTSNGSLNSSTTDPNGIMQTNKLRAELIETKARLNQVQEKLKQNDKKRRMELSLAESKVSSLQAQSDYTSNKMVRLLEEMEKMRGIESSYKEEMRRAKAELAALKLKYDDTVSKLKNEKAQQEHDARDVQLCINNELAEYRRHAQRSDLELQSTLNELESIRQRHDEYKVRVSGFEELRANFEKQQQSLKVAEERIKDLEFEIQSYTDWKQVTKVSQERLASIPEMDAELQRLRIHNRQLNKIIGDKLLLEEQVHEYKARLDKEEGARAEAASLQVKLTHTEQELKEWVKVAQDHCLANTLVSPAALRSRIEQLLQGDIVHVSEKYASESESKQMRNAVRDLEQKVRIYLKNIEDLNMNLKRHKNFKDRLQRKLRTVSRERDFYKQMVDNFDKDLTMSNASVAEMTQDMQVRYRVDVLERTVTGYKDLCATLDREIQAMRDQEQLSDPSSEDYENVKKELDTLRIENDRLRRRKEEQELEMMQRCLRQDISSPVSKVVHFADNPAAEAYESSKNMFEKLQAEIERLKRHNKKLEDANEQHLNETTTSTGGMTMNFKELNKLRAELESANAKLGKTKEHFMAARKEFRDVVYMLLGYRIDRVGYKSNYRVTSMYAESPDDYFSIALSESNDLALLETPYSETLQPALDQQLAANNSFPPFFSSLTLDLFQRATVTIN
ncbi:mitotic spindle assembly checkpoint protein MAD1 [Drosophila subobscura]|uniref:mitotic spindle assembly checkpoint protein MAD1 n=1 Tax=Drosophila subobscura TaxID=7241 RepID=UPI00155A1818|nr:mitotic spindle assembly checkpoint protein MAD1 [Drosophila subobscura]